MPTRTARLHGHTLSAHLHDTAGAEAPLVVLVHGMMEPADVWQPVIERIGRRYRCVSLELPWNGTQGVLWGRPLSPHEWLRAALDTFDLRPHAWLAHSFGASTLLSLLASGRTDRGLAAPTVLISPFFKASHHEVSWPLFEGYVRRFTEFVELSIRTRVGARGVDADVLRRMTETARDAFGCYVWMQFWQQFAEMPFLQLDGLRQPMLVLNGSEDFSSPLHDARSLVDALPCARLLALDGASHFLLSSHRDAVVEALDRFLQRSLLPGCAVECRGETFA